MVSEMWSKNVHIFIELMLSMTNMKKTTVCEPFYQVRTLFIKKINKFASAIKFDSVFSLQNRSTDFNSFIQIIPIHCESIGMIRISKVMVSEMWSQSSCSSLNECFY